MSILDRVEYRLIESEADREDVYRLRYRAYLNEGAILPNETGLLTDSYDDAENSWIFGLYAEDCLVSSIRISVGSQAAPHTPATDAFADILAPEIEQGKIIVDPNRFVADPDPDKRLPELPYLTVRLGYVACAHFNADIGTATVRKEHQAFYRRVFLQHPLCEPRPYPTLTKPLCLMAANYVDVRDRIFQRYPHFRSTALERVHLFSRASVPGAPPLVPALPDAPPRRHLLPRRA